MLGELSESLATDIMALQQLESQGTSLTNANKTLIGQLDGNIIDQKEVGQMVNLTAGHLNIVFQTSAFQSLISKGSEVLTVDSIRVGILNLHDIACPQLIEELENYKIHLRNEWRPFMLDHFKYSLVETEDPLEPDHLRSPVDWGVIRSFPKVRNIVLLNLFITAGCADRSRQVSQQAQDLQTRIGIYLRNN